MGASAAAVLFVSFIPSPVGSLWFWLFWRTHVILLPVGAISYRQAIMLHSVPICLRKNHHRKTMYLDFLLIMAFLRFVEETALIILRAFSGELKDGIRQMNV
jgi:hypothetical protein